jgi:organic hydroperoxide reductase OsmC/OhrA
MLGTLVGALEVRAIPLEQDAISAVAEGINEVRDRLPVLTEIVVHYTLRVPAGHRDKVDRALGTHQEKCPTASSLKAAVAIRWTADVTEL